MTPSRPQVYLIKFKRLDLTSHRPVSRVVVLVLALVLKDKFKVLVLVLGAQVLVQVLVLEEKSLVVSLFLVFFSRNLQSFFCETCFQTHITCEILHT